MRKDSTGKVQLVIEYFCVYSYFMKLSPKIRKFKNVAYIMKKEKSSITLVFFLWIVRNKTFKNVIT